MGTGCVSERRALFCAVLAAATVALMLAMAPGASAASGYHASFSAHGSVKQVYVTGLASRARMSLLDHAGRTIATKRADSLGGLLFRDVKPGTGYRVRLSRNGAESGPLRVLSTRPRPRSTSIYNQTIPSSGYGYLTTRDGTKLAIYVHPPQDWTKAVTSTAGIPPPVFPALKARS